MLDGILAHIVHLGENESIKAIIRRSWLCQILNLVIAGFLLLAPFFFIYPLFKEGKIGIVIFGVAIIIGLIVLWRAIIEYNFTAWIVTERRIIDCEQKGFFRREISEISYDQISDITSARRGLKSIFGLSSLTIELKNDKKIKFQINNIRHAERQKGQITVWQQRQKDYNARTLLNRIRNKVGPEEFKKLIAE